MFARDFYAVFQGHANGYDYEDIVEVYPWTYNAESSTVVITKQFQDNVKVSTYQLVPLNFNEHDFAKEMS